jgi:hypothetical protein
MISYKPIPVYTAKIIWEPSVADPAHLVWAILPDGTMFNGTKWQRFLIRLLSKSLMKQRNKNIEAIGKVVI